MTTPTSPTSGTPRMDACISKHESSSLLYQFQMVAKEGRQLERELAAAREEITGLATMYNEARKENVKLREYAVHTIECELTVHNSHSAFAFPNLQCTCGLEGLLR